MLARVDRPHTGNLKYAISFARAQFKFKFKFRKIPEEVGHLTLHT